MPQRFVVLEDSLIICKRFFFFRGRILANLIPQKNDNKSEANLADEEAPTTAWATASSMLAWQHHCKP